MNTGKLILHHFIDLGGIATKNNFYSHKSLTIKGSRIRTDVHFNRFLKLGLVERLEPTFPLRDYWREVFYRITKKGSQYIGREDEYKRGISKVKSPYNVFHESMVRDVALTFLRLYPDCSVQIRYDEIFKNKKESIKPDLTIRLEKDGKKYVFLIEIERKKTVERVKKEKLDKYEKVFTEKNGLPDNFKVLVIYANLEYNPFLRPQEYVEHEQRVLRVGEQLENLAEMCRDLPDYRYRFLAFPDFYRLNQPLWLTPKGNKTSLITE